MTASQEAKKHGFKSLKEVSDLLGKKPNGRPVALFTTLNLWHNTKPTLFKAVLVGLAQIKKEKENAKC